MGSRLYDLLWDLRKVLRCFFIYKMSINESTRVKYLEQHLAYIKVLPLNCNLSSGSSPLPPQSFSTQSPDRTPRHWLYPDGLSQNPQGGTQVCVCVCLSSSCDSSVQPRLKTTAYTLGALNTSQQNLSPRLVLRLSGPGTFYSSPGDSGAWAGFRPLILSLPTLIHHPMLLPD